jgi:hypothetical protein
MLSFFLEVEEKFYPNTLLLKMRPHKDSTWTGNNTCPDDTNKCHSWVCPHNSGETSTNIEVRHIQTQLNRQKYGQKNIVSMLNHQQQLQYALPTKRKEYATYDDIAHMLENTYGIINGSNQSYRKLLSQKTCRHYGEPGKAHSPRCQMIHQINDILFIFNDVNLIEFYKIAPIRLDRGMGEEKPVNFLVRDVSDFQCLSQRSPQCELNIYFYTYTVNLMAKYNNELIYPTCILTCDFCKQSRSVVIYK